ncbi:MAG: hypothetical protein HY695_35880 [Deltaproteobacteria bacterium]|nr:hypothetical protein [Deltaproteobacteria bacterium]
MPAAPQIAIILRPDGTVEDVSVLAKDHRDRIIGFHVIEMLTEELEVFEARAKKRLEQLSRVQ